MNWLGGGKKRIKYKLNFDQGVHVINNYTLYNFLHVNKSY